MGSRMKWICWLYLTAGLLSAQPLKVLLVTGGHDHDISFYGVFPSRPEMEINVNPHPGSFRGDLAKRYDVLVLYDMTEIDDPAEREALQKYLQAGKGLVALHHSIVSAQNWPWWHEEVLGGRYRQKADSSGPASTFQHDVDLQVRPVGDHPVLTGIEPFQIHDEAYKDMWISPRVKVLLETDNALNDKPMAWIGIHPKGRVIYIELGHGREAHESPVYRKLVRNAIYWAAGRPIP